MFGYKRYKRGNAIKMLFLLQKAERYQRRGFDVVISMGELFLLSHNKNGSYGIRINLETEL